MQLVAGRLSWRWSDALWAAVGVLPACTVIAGGHVSTGIAMCIGLLPVGLAGMRPRRRRRILSVSAGVLFAAFLVAGSAISQVAWLAVVGMFTIPVIVLLARVPPSLQRLALALLLPAVSVGLSFGEVGDALSLAWAIVVGALWMTIISLAWPERPPEVPVPAAAMTADQARTWGLMLGGAAGTATLVGELADFSHVGWAPTAALLVMRPQRELLTLRGTGRVFATLAGAVAAAGGLALAPRSSLLAGAVGLVLIATIATRGILVPKALARRAQSASRRS